MSYLQIWANLAIARTELLAAVAVYGHWSVQIVDPNQ